MGWSPETGYIHYLLVNTLAIWANTPPADRQWSKYRKLGHGIWRLEN
jgi:hypothetical protein